MYKISIYKMGFGRLIIDRYGVWVRRPHDRPRLQIKSHAARHPVYRDYQLSTMCAPPVARDYGSSGANSEIKA